MAAFELLAVLVALLFTALYYYVTSTADYWARRGVPYLKPTPFIGNSKEYLLITEFRGTVTQRFYSYARSRGHKYLGVFLGRRPILLVSDAEFVKTVMVRDFEYFMDRGMFFDRKLEPLSAHLFNMKGAEWKNLRAKLTPTFTSGKMRNMFHLLRACSDEFMVYLKEYVETGQELEMSEALARFTTDVIGTCAFGIETNALKNPNAEFRTMGRNVFSPGPFRSTMALISEVLPQIRKILPVNPMRPDVADFFRKMFNDNVQYRENNKVVRHDFLDLLIQLKQKGSVSEPLTNGSKSSTAGKGRLRLVTLYLMFS